MSVLLAYAILSAAQWAAVARQLRSPAGWCGNLVSDPFSILVNWAAPLAAVCTAWLLRRCLERRRWPRGSGVMLLTFLATTAGLIAEGMWLEASGLPLGRIWWWPWL